MFSPIVIFILGSIQRFYNSILYTLLKKINKMQK
nr:MAG TPA: hypothetical protein [Caudoviricetes sp.]